METVSGLDLSASRRDADPYGRVRVYWRRACSTRLGKGNRAQQIGQSILTSMRVSGNWHMGLSAERWRSIRLAATDGRVPKIAVIDRCPPLHPNMPDVGCPVLCGAHGPRMVNPIPCVFWRPAAAATGRIQNPVIPDTARGGSKDSQTPVLQTQGQSVAKSCVNARLPPAPDCSCAAPSVPPTGPRRPCRMRQR